MCCFEFRLVHVAFLVVLLYFVQFGIFVLMYHINKTGEITSISGDHIPCNHGFFFIIFFKLMLSNKHFLETTNSSADFLNKQSVSRQIVTAELIF